MAGTRVRQAVARALVPIVLAAMFSPLDAVACRCIPATLSNRFEHSANVFTAVITAQYQQASTFGSRIYSTFEVTDSFKGLRPFPELISHSADAVCDLYLEEGGEYLFFAPDSGEIGNCEGIIRTEYAEPQISALRAYVAGEYRAIAEPWQFERSESGCSLRTAFDRGDDTLPGLLQLSASSERTHLLPQFALAELTIRFDGGREPVGARAPLQLIVGGITATASWTSGRSIPVPLPNGDPLVVQLLDAYVLEGDAVEAVLRALTIPNRSLILRQADESVSYRDFEVHTANLGEDGARMLQCLQDERAK